MILLPRNKSLHGVCMKRLCGRARGARGARAPLRRARSDAPYPLHAYALKFL
jgi:hypothetical protein